ncbi:MAG: hypothetical protein K6B65_06605 [Bacilli bacterium]|nr:hypothetical protein [Bacilli bacterium]
MKFSRDNDERCYALCKMQASIFDHAYKDFVPSYYFIKVYMNSIEASKLDDLSVFLTGMSQESIYASIKSKIKKKSGTLYSAEEIHWIGYIYRCASYMWDKESKWLFKHIAPSYLRGVYYPYHSLDVKKALQLIWDDRIGEEETGHERIMRILRESKFL